MQTSLRKMGNSIGMIVPRAVLAEIGATTGAKLDLRVEDGRIIASPVVTNVRRGWAEDAAAIANNDDAAEWRAVLNEADAEWEW
jgi:antitoxin MazE